jgi:hypothetical protein
VGAASNLEIHDARPPATHLIHHTRAAFLLNARIAIAAFAGSESKFLNRRRKSRVQTPLSQFANCCKKIFTNPSSESRQTVFSKRFAPLWG